jgi:ABC-type sugar transport system permease subunit
VFFLPTFAPLVGSSVVWLLIFTPGGFLDWVMASLHVPLPNLITDPMWAMQCVVIVSLWAGFGYNLLLFGAALESIPQQYLDAAAIDGTTPWQRFWRIKLPLISPSLFFGIVLTAITSLQVFDQVYALTRGGPGAATQTLGYKIYRDGFISYNFGYASSIAWLLFGAALESIPQQYLDAAAIDGASAWQRFWLIKIPMISPSLFFGIVLTAITSLQVFDQVYALTRGGPGAATQTLGYKIYRDGFISYNFGYASSVAWILFVIIMVLTAIQLRLQRKWVHYDA